MTDASESVLVLDVATAPEPDPAAAPDGFVVQVDDGTRIHFLDWGGPVNAGADSPGGPAGPAAARVLLVHGLAQTAWTWTPVARRLRRVARVVAVDLRGHGLSDSPTEGYDADSLTQDLVAAAEGSGLLDAGGSEAGESHEAGESVEAPPQLVLVGHGFGAIVASWAAASLGDRVAGLVLVDGGWEDLGRGTGLDPDEFMRGLDEPPEVLRTMAAFLADRRDFDPATWDADQETAARATVVETHAKRLTPATRPHAVAASVGAMFQYDPLIVLPSVEARIVALQAADDEEGTHSRALAEVQSGLSVAGRPAIRVARFPDAGHNLMRYRPREVTAAILTVAGTLRR